jgi:Tfp pilus assembly protein PilO
VSDQLHGTALMRRVFAEHRRLILPLAILLLLNIVVYAAGVYPLAQRVANIEDRTRSAEQALAQAQREHTAARGALTGKERATVELATFYKDVLPTDLPSARRLTYLRLNQLAREAGLTFKTGTFDVEEQRTSTLERVRITLTLEGDYDAMRRFIYQLDTAPEFVVIDDVSLAERGNEDGGLDLQMQLSTYYSKAPTP